ncbi:MAG: Gfo/Idh/MocA family oxidoreductase [Pseudomonadota bacterium]|nr:Gfo/Idh/MocA family oxidoreductase [Pseudomonadota bacterium]
MKEQRLNIAVVGTGYFSQFHYDAWGRLPVKIKGVCSLASTEAKTVANQFEGCKAFTDFKRMLDETEPELLDIIVQPSKQPAIVKAAIERKINVICQKPFTETRDQAMELVEFADANKVLLAVHENFRFQPWHLEIKKLIQKGILGDPYQITFRMRPGDGRGEQAYLDRQPYFQTMRRFLIHETAIHLIDVFRFYFGEIDSVTADLRRLNSNIAGEDAAIIVFNFKSGVCGLFDGNRLSDHIAADKRRTMGEMLIEGSNGSIRLNGDGDIFFRTNGENDERQIDYPWDNIGFAGDSVYNYQKHVLDHISEGTRLYNSGKEYLKNIEIEELVYLSNEKNKKVIIK